MGLNNLQCHLFPPAELLGQATLPVGFPSRPLSRRQVCPLTPGPREGLGPAATMAVEVRWPLYVGRWRGELARGNPKPGFPLSSLHSFSMRRAHLETWAPPLPPHHAPVSPRPRRSSWTGPSCPMAPLSPQSPLSSPGPEQMAKSVGAAGGPAWGGGGMTRQGRTSPYLTCLHPLPVLPSLHPTPTSSYPSMHPCCLPPSTLPASLSSQPLSHLWPPPPHLSTASLSCILLSFFPSTPTASLPCLSPSNFPYSLGSSRASPHKILL